MQKTIRDGLILRSLSEGHESDTAQLAEFYKRVFEEDGDEDTDGFLPWTDDLLNAHPSMTPDNFMVVVDPAADEKLVSALLLIPQTWTYAGIEIPVGRVEIVATDKAYRRRGLVRELMNAIHERSAALGHLVQGITGIPYFYRQFGYSMTVDNLTSRCIVQFSSFRPLSNDETPKFTLRTATTDDIPVLIAIDDFAASRYLLFVKRDETLWRYEIEGRQSTYDLSMDIQLILDREQRVVGYMLLRKMGAYGGHLPVWAYVVGENSSMLATYADVIRGLEKHVPEQHPGQNIHSLMFNAGIDDTLDALVERTMGAGFRKNSYAWYLRIADPVAFMTKIVPVLENRLEGSGAHRFTGTFTIGFYKLEKLVLTFEDGKFMGADYGETDKHPDAEFPFDLFLNIVFGHHNYMELRHIHSDIRCNAKGRVLLDILFPKQRSLLAAIG